MAQVICTIISFRPSTKCTLCLHPQSLEGSRGLIFPERRKPELHESFYQTRRALPGHSAALPLLQWKNPCKRRSLISGKSHSAPSTSARSFLSRAAPPFAPDLRSPPCAPGAASDSKGTTSSSSPETTTSFPSTRPHYLGWPAGESERSSKDAAYAREPRRLGQERHR
jgi:hypothetical protein